MKSQFLQGANGALFSILHSAETPVGSVLFCPPFADELNKSRRMVALQCKALQQAGYSTLQIDPIGTGDSAGAFSDARWCKWLSDLEAAWHWLYEESGKPPVLWGLRTGALLACELSTRDGINPPALLLWQPVASGKTFIGQYLRLRLAAGMFGGIKESAADLRAILNQGDVLEVAGYGLHPELLSSMEGSAIKEPFPKMPVVWFDITRDASKPLSPAVTRLRDKWQAGRAKIDIQSVTGEPFWSTPEISTVPALVPATLQSLNKVLGK